MVKIVEFRVILPMTVQEYQIGQLYSVADASMNQTGGGDGIEVVLNQPFDESSPKEMQPTKPELRCCKYHPTPLMNGQFTKGQYTYKIYHLEKKVPGWLQTLAPKGCLRFEEKAWNAYPYCRTIIDNPEYMKEYFYVMIETMHCDDYGQQENVHGLEGEELQAREVVYIDIADRNQVSNSDYKADEDPTKFKSEKTQRGPLHPKWVEEYKQRGPVMCAYKLVKIFFKWKLIQDKTERFIVRQEQRLFTNFHRQLFCWMDKWHGMTMQEIRELEEKTKADLEKARKEGSLRGMSAADEKK